MKHSKFSFQSPGAHTPIYRTPTPPPTFVPPPSKKATATRRCLADGKDAIFHRWADIDRLYIKCNTFLNMVETVSITGLVEKQRIIPKGLDTEHIRTVKALVEYTDGQVALMDVEKIRFIKETAE